MKDKSSEKQNSAFYSKTIYDAVDFLKSKVSKKLNSNFEAQDIKNYRNTLEGAIILSSPAIAFSGEKLKGSFYPADSVFKYVVGSVIRDNFFMYGEYFSNNETRPSIKNILSMGISNNDLVNIIDPKKRNLKEYSSKIFSVNKKLRIKICQEIGKELEDKLPNYYLYNGYSRLETTRVNNYLRSEFDLISNIVENLSEKRTKLKIGLDDLKNFEQLGDD